MLPLMQETGKKTIHEASALAFALFGAAFFLLFHAFFLDLTQADSDTGWHLAAGRLILESRSVVDRDPWSFTAGETTWYNLSWLFDAVIAWVHQSYGMATLHILTLFSGCAIFGGALFLAARRGAAIPAALIAALPIMLYLPQSLTLRPQLSTLLLILVCYGILASRQRFFLIPLLTLPWTNMHGGVLLVFPILGAFGVEALIEKNWRHAWNLTFCGIACALAILCTPWGFQVFEGMQRTLGGESRAFIDEWKAPKLGGDMVPTLWLLLSAFAVFRRNVPWSDRLLAIGFGGLAMTALRHVMPWMLLSLPAVALEISRISKLSLLGETIMRDLARPRSLHVSGLCLTAALMIVAGTPKHLRPATMQQIPAAEIAWIVEHVPGARIFNAYNYGGMIIANKNNLKVFVDGRAETAYPGSVLVDYRRFHFMEEGWQTLPERYGANVILFPKDAPQTGWFRNQPQWREAFAGEVASVLVREGGER